MVLFARLSTWLAPLWMVAVGLVFAVGGLLGVYFLLQSVAPKVAAVARTTTKEALSQPLFPLLLAAGAFALFLFPLVPYNTFGEDIKMVTEEGLTLIMLLSIFLALWTASVSVSEEIEGRTALTLLSKPVGRRSFIIGKFLGIAGPVAIMFIVLGALFLGSVSYKVVYDARENVLPEPTAEQCRDEMLQIVPGLALTFMEAMVLASISVAISTRLPMLPNLVICFSIYALGHLVPMLVESSAGQFEIIAFVGTLLATILPVLDYFNIHTAVATGKAVPWLYVGVAGIYALLYCGLALLVALLAFERRDLA